MSKRKQLLQRYDPRVVKLALLVCERIEKLAPDAEETVFLRWRTITFGFARKRICAVAPHKEHVNLQFHKGADLHDPDELLEGTGSKMRHVKIHNPADA